MIGGAGWLVAVRELLGAAEEGATRSAGPRFFHFVMGGGTPAALAADWLTSALDQIAFNWVSSPFAMRLEQIALGWLKELFGLPAPWSGVLTSGATMANVTCLAAARRWWGREHGVDVEEAGLSELPPIPVLASGHVHASVLKALGLLGVGRGHVRTFAADASGRLDLDALLDRALAVSGYHEKSERFAREPRAVGVEVHAVDLATGRDEAVGVGLVVGGQPVFGCNHCELGHVRIARWPGDLWPGICRFHGDCVEGLASGPAIAARAGSLAKDIPDDSPVWELAAHALAQLFHTMVLATAPRRILVGGGVVQARPQILGYVRRLLIESLNGYLDLEELSGGIDRYVVPPGLGALAADAHAMSRAARATVV